MLYVKQNGTLVRTNSLYTKKDNRIRKIGSVWCRGENGTLMRAESFGTSLHDAETGTTVLISENGNPTPYRIWQKGYGVPYGVLLVREYALPNPVRFSETGGKTYADSIPDRVLRETYLPTLPNTLREKLISVPLPMSEGESAVSRETFLLSAGEIGMEEAVDGTVSPYFVSRCDAVGANIARRARVSDTATEDILWFTRSRYPNSVDFRVCVTRWGQTVGYPNDTVSAYLRPALCVDERYLIA